MVFRYWRRCGTICQHRRRRGHSPHHCPCQEWKGHLRREVRVSNDNIVQGFEVNVTYTYNLSRTGPANSTGAYELDPSQLGNFNKAWRTLHVKTDVFCAASLTLPDRAGRQINVGGWSAPSTKGIRLYWPDGSPGVPGTNDFQENVNVLSLQAGRWYPSAMTMANGSILVMGGEEGSNGAPVPNLEVLPPAGGLLDCPYLRKSTSLPYFLSVNVIVWDLY